MSLTDLLLIMPVIMLPVFGLVVLILGVVADRFPNGRINHWLPPEYLSLALITPTIFIAGAALWGTLAQPILGTTMPTWIRDVLTIDPFAAFLSLAAIIGTGTVMVLSLEYFGDHNTRHRSEFFALLFFATTGIVIATAACDFLLLYLAIELLSLSSYVLAAYWKNDAKSSEAGIKYFIFGALCSAIMLYGMSMLFGLVGSTSFAQLASALASGDVPSTTATWAAVLMVFAGLGFKLALVPFHLWAPDVYEGAPTPISAWLSVSSKAAGIAAVTRFLFASVPQSSGIDWYWMLVVLSAVSMTLGNLTAITQKNIKRMLAYSSIAQVGYMMIGLLAAASVRGNILLHETAKSAVISTGNSADTGLSGLLIYAAAYLFMNLGAFAVVIAVERKRESAEIEKFSGLASASPFLAGAMVVFFMSLAGIPPTAGFLGKFYVFAAAIESARSELMVLAIIGIANSVISVYYYFNVVRVMFMKESEPKTLTASRTTAAVVALMLILTIGLGLAAQPIARLALSAISPGV